MPRRAFGDNLRAPADTATAVRCPKCERILMEYKLTGNVANRIDVCSRVEEFKGWLDGTDHRSDIMAYLYRK